jgi:osmotically-inducible protein OsmY
MKSTLTSLSLASLVVLGFATGCDRNDRAKNPPEPNRTAGQVIDDKALAASVRAALDADSFKYPDVKVAAYKGVVQLSGFADTKEQKSHAGDVAEKVANVTKVENNITLKETKNP